MFAHTKLGLNICIAGATSNFLLLFCTYRTLLHSCLVFHFIVPFKWRLRVEISAWKCHGTYLLYCYSSVTCYPFTIRAAADQFPNRNYLTSSPKIETGNHYYSHYLKELYMIASECGLSNSNDPKNLLHRLPVIVGISFTARGTRSS